jgi:hypothetical protein
MKQVEKKQNYNLTFFEGVSLGFIQPARLHFLQHCVAVALQKCSRAGIEPPCSLELISQISQLFTSVFLSQQISEQYFQPWPISQANRAETFMLTSSFLRYAYLIFRR